MNIAILEDLQSDYELLRDILQRNVKKQNNSICLHWFSDGESFLNDITSTKYDLFFLDMLLGDGMNGMDVARRVRLAGYTTPIVFTTSEPDFALEGYEVQAIDYLIKPYEPERIQAVVERVLTTLQKRYYLTVAVGRGTQCICCDDLMWAEARDHYIELHMINDKTILATLSFGELLQALPSQPQFQNCCRGIIINLDYADALQENDFLLKNGTKVPVSRRKRIDMQACLSDYAIYKTRREMDL